jgi:hypothetical protein
LKEPELLLGPVELQLQILELGHDFIMATKGRDRIRSCATRFGG